MPTSAVNDESHFMCLVVSLEGRMYPVEVAYLSEPVADYVEAAVRTIFDIHLKVTSGIDHGRRSRLDLILVIHRNRLEIF
jgi:HrpA-like RNA helicase